MGETKREKWQRCRRFSQIFADLVLDLRGKWFGAAENCRKPQETAGNLRKSQEAVSTPFSHLVSPHEALPKTNSVSLHNCFQINLNSDFSSVTLHNCFGVIEGV